MHGDHGIDARVAMPGSRSGDGRVVAGLGRAHATFARNT